MESDWFYVLDRRIEAFNLEIAQSPKAWHDWFTQYKILLRATAFDRLPDKQKVSLLLTKCKGFEPVYEVLSIDEDTINYDALVAELNNYFTPVYARNAFFSRQQQKNETFEEFAEALKALSLPCHFLDDKIVRDAFVLNMSNDTIARQILISGDPSLEEAILRAKSLAHEPESNGSYSDLAAEEPSDIFSRKCSITSNKMPLTTVTNKGGFRQSKSPFPPGEDHIVNNRSRQYSDYRNTSGGQRDGRGATEDFNEKRRRARSETRERQTDNLPVDGYKADLGRGVHKKSTGPRESADDNSNADCSARPRGQRYSSSRDGNHHNRQEQFKRSSQEKDSGYTTSESARNDNPPNNRSRGQGGFNRSSQEKDNTGSIRARIDNPPNNPVRGQGDNFTRNQQETDNCSTRSNQSRNGNPLNQPFRTGERNVGGSNQPRNGNPPNDRPFRRQGDFNRNPRESEDGFTGNNQSRNRYPPNNRPSRGQGDSNRNCEESDNGFTRNNQPRNGCPPNNRPSRGQGDPNRNCEESDHGFNQNNQPRNGYPPNNQPSRGQGDSSRNCEEFDNGFTRNNELRNGYPPNNRPSRRQGDSNRNSEESDNGSSRSNQPRNGNPPNNLPSRRQGDSSRNCEESDNGFTQNNHPRNGYPPNNRPSRGQGDSNRNCEESDNGFTRNNQPRNGNPQGPGRGYLCAPSNKPATSRPQSGFTPQPVELHLARNASTNNYASAQPELSDEFANHPPIPLEKFTELMVTYKSERGDVFFTDKVAQLNELTEELLNVRRTVLSDPRKDMWCLVEHETYNYRAEIFRVHPSGERFKVRLLDFGEETVKVSEEIMVLPPKYHEIPPYAFGIKLPEGVCVEEGDTLRVKPVSADANGVWLVDVDQSAKPTQPAQSTRSPTPPRRPQLPPIPKNTFSEVRVVYTGPEGNFVVDVSKLADLKRIQDQIAKVPKTPLKGFPEEGGLYIAPYGEGEFYRAQVLSVDGHSCVVSFVDFGNEAEVRASDLIQLPKSLQGNVHTFKITTDSGAALTYGHDVKVTPLIMEPSGAWLVQVEGEPFSPDLPEDSDISFNRK